MRDLDDLFAALSRSRFRSQFRLNAKDAAYVEQKGLPAVLEHAAKFVQDRLAPAHPHNDGRQTPWRGHPVFAAQHATATCCRSCLAKWHGIKEGEPLTLEQIDYVVRVVGRWLETSGAPHTATCASHLLDSGASSSNLSKRLGSKFLSKIGIR